MPDNRALSLQDILALITEAHMEIADTGWPHDSKGNYDKNSDTWNFTAMTQSSNEADAMCIEKAFRKIREAEKALTSFINTHHCFLLTDGLKNE